MYFTRIMNNLLDDIALLEIAISYSLLKGDFTSYMMLANRYAQLAQDCLESEFSWSY